MIELHRDDCFNVLPNIADHSVNLVIADLPYGITRCEWDNKIGLEAFWSEMKRVIAPYGVVLMFGTQPFTSELIESNRGQFKYEMIWEKNRPTGFQHCNQRVLNAHENIILFSEGVLVHPGRSKKQMTYNPQDLVELEVPRARKAEHRVGFLGKTILKGVVQTHTNWPRSVLKFNGVHKPVHSSQKPVPLLRYLIRSFSNKGETVLDPTMGAGSTGVAARDEGRSFIGIELEQKYYDIAKERIEGVEA